MKGSGSQVWVWAAVAMLVLTLAAVPGRTAPPAAREPRGTVWIVYFSSRDCPFCTGVARLLRGLAKKYPIAVKKFNVDKPQDAALLERIEAVHAAGRLSVPVVMLDETILMGEEQITARLESAVRACAAAGGSALPYLGPADAEKRPVGAKLQRDRPAYERRPPSIGEEWARIRDFIQRLF